MLRSLVGSEMCIRDSTDPAALDKLLTAIPGVIETGLFCKLADVIIYGDETGISVDGG